MNQKMPTQRPPQRQTQRPTQRPNLSPTPHKTVSPKYGRAFVILMVTTVSLLLVSLIVLGVILCVGGFESKTPPIEDSADTPASTQTPKPSTDASKPNSSIKSKTNIKLPCATSGIQSYPTATAVAIAPADGIESQAAALIDVTNGRAVALKNGDQKVYPASMTKVMTLLVACENAMDPTALLTVTEEMMARYKSFCTPGEDGPSIATAWKAGDQVTVEDALYLVIYKSDTYACWMLAEHIAGSEAAFVQMMNDRVSALGLSATTHFENSTGLYHDNHYTTCVDMATIMAAAMNNATAKTVLTTYKQYIVDLYTGGVKSASLSLYSGWYTARLEKYPYNGAAPYYAGNGSDIRLIAGKTGYETVPKYCFVTAGQNDETGTLFVCVQVGGDTPKDSTDDTREIYQKFARY